MIPENKITKWHNCYGESWKDIIVPEAFSHPAKMSYGLLKRILAHAQEQGWLNGIILDPFGGIGSMGILGAYEGYQVICVELERKFVDLAIENFVLHENAWEKLGCPLPVMIQGDSRRLCEVVEKADCIIGSPPFGSSLESKDREFREKSTPGRTNQCSDYGQTPGQLGAMKPGKVDMVLSSPPYAETLKGDGTQNETAAESRDKRRTPGGSLGQSQRTQGYGSQENLGNLKSGDVDCVISSPPFDTHVGGDLRVDNKKRKTGGDLCMSSGKNFGHSPGQLLQEQGDTFWSAAKIIVEQCHQILKPGGHAIWVVKSFVRNKKIVDFPGDWQRLCENAGFKTVCIHHAMLVKETTHETLFGHTEVKRKERKSFFRRLAESKGSPKIDFEVVLCMSRKETKCKK